MPPRTKVPALGDTKLFEPIKIGRMDLKHRIIMAPLTRVRCPEHIPNSDVITYYSQRATPGGLLISEAAHISVMGGNFYGAPGIFTPEQLRAWKKVTSAVHAKGGYIYCQLWHIGRAAVPANLGGRKPHGPSANVIPNGKAWFTPVGPQPSVIAHAMTLEDIDNTVDDYVHAARTAIEAGFDGVEIHNANGYLLDQFLCDNINTRTDAYGGSPENRARLSLRVIDAIVAAIGADRVGIRFSPFSFYQGTFTSDIHRDYGHVIAETDKRQLAYIHLIGPEMDLTQAQEKKRAQLIKVAEKQGVSLDRFEEEFSLKPFKALIKNTLVVGNGSYDERYSGKGLEEGTMDAVAYGRMFISNPDFVERLRRGWELAPYNIATFYSPGPKGFVDYPEYEGKREDARL
ncbi:FMN-linked oxidoreductase [Ascodesmis nigricans]|uniref:FMN-linked oxidoreductase n=1 Tax=Ascodesmis nigricans TaxID=341454 RepID=A0A4S2MI68_9PEZI|nr:FMN-linked oxidoreductase [Ascodesmis nigricans]